MVSINVGGFSVGNDCCLYGKFVVFIFICEGFYNDFFGLIVCGLC